MWPTPWALRTCRARLSPFVTRRLSTKSSFLSVSEEVQQTISENRPVVALETTIYTHGFPYPDNVALSSSLESLVRSNGGVPATIGILDGVAHVGMAEEQLERLLSAKDTLKVSRRDMGFVTALKDAQGNRLNGGTTIAGTMVLAHLAGIKIFATGGLGGVHRGAEQTFDVSADLTELGRTPVTVISSGCKGFLDIPKTIEYLETQGVAVATFADGRKGDVPFPGFWVRNSGFKSPRTIETETDAANVVHAHLSLGLQSGLFFANPIPEEHSMPSEDMDRAIEQALQEALEAGCTGAATTPYILNKIKELTGRKAVVSNRALVEANVIRGTRVAVELSRLQSQEGPALGQMRGPAASNYTVDGVAIGISSHVPQPDVRPPPPATGSIPDRHIEPRKADIFVAGTIAVDLSCDFDPPEASSAVDPEAHTSNPSVIRQSLGGVGSNVARATHLMGGNVRLCSVVGDDLAGKAALEAVASIGMADTSIMTLPKESLSRTAQYIAVNNRNKDLVFAMADMNILAETPLDTFDNFWLPQLCESQPSFLAVDGNWSSEQIGRWLEAGKGVGAKIVFEPVSNFKSRRVFHSSPTLSTFPSASIHIATPNQHELAAMHDEARRAGFFDRPDWWTVLDALGIPSTGARTQLALATSAAIVDQGIPQQCIQLLPFIPTFCTKLGSQGVLVTQLLSADDPRLSSGDSAPYILSRCTNGTENTLGVGGVYMRLFPPAEDVKPEEVVSVNGVGDTFVGTLLAGLAKRGKQGRVEDLIDLAQRAAVLSLKSPESVSPGLGTLRVLM